MRRKICKTSKTSMVSLPDHIITEIMLLLPIKSIIMCKCTCKALRYLISSTDFVNLHYARAKPCILLANFVSFDYISRLMYLIEPSSMNNTSHVSDDYCVCYVNGSSEGVNLKLDTKLKIPICNDKIARASGDYVIVNSCNGFLCLYRGPQTYVVCNPVTNEYMKVPSPVNYVGWSDVCRGFGFCPKTKQYKVVRWLKSTDRKAPLTSEIHTLKTHKRWRTLVGTPQTINFRAIEHPIYAKGFIFWVYRDLPPSFCILSFDFEVERFRLLPKPPIDYRHTDVRMEMIGDRLSLYARPSRDKIDIWIIENFGGVDEHWSKYVSVDIINTPRLIRSHTYSCVITTCPECETSFILHHRDKRIIIYESKRQIWRRFKIHQSKFEGKTTIYIPSFFSLKDAVPGANVKSISTEFVLSGEKRSPYFREEVSVRVST